MADKLGTFEIFVFFAQGKTLHLRNCRLASSFLPASSPGEMLQVRIICGEAVAGIPAEELGKLSDIRGLKTCLIELHGLVPRFRQRLLVHGEILEKTTMLHSPMHLHLLFVLPFADVCQSQVHALAAAAECGSNAKSRVHAAVASRSRPA